MNLSDFINQYKGKDVSYDGIKDNFGQCEQLVCVWWEQAYGFKCPPIPAAKDLWTNPTVLQSFDQIPVGQEQPGDVAVFGASPLINSPEFGHTDIVVTPGFEGFDSNWASVKAPDGYPAAHLVQHTYTDVLGFLRFKKGDDMTLPTKQQVAEAYEKHNLDINGNFAPATDKDLAYYSTQDVAVLYSVLLDHETALVHQLVAQTAKGATPLAPGTYLVK